MIDLDNQEGIIINADELEKLKKKKMKKLSSSILRKKLKLPNKVLRECNSVNHVKIPRKLRSAMKKRNSESVSPPLLDKKKRNYAIDGDRFAGDEGKKKLRMNRNDKSEIAQITKDEEEAVETLFSLAKMFPSNNKNGFKRETTEEKSPPLAPENEESARETLEAKCLIEPMVSLEFQTVNPNPSVVSTSSSSEAEPSMSTNSKQLAYEEAAACERSPDIAAAIAAAVANLHKREFTMENSKSIGFWPGLSSAVSFGADTKKSPISSPTDYNPAWMSLNPSKSEPSSSKDDTLPSKDFGDPFVRNKSWKRCLAHANIGRLIKSLQTAEKMSNIPIDPLNQLAKNEELKLEARIDNSVSEIVIAEKNHDETRNAILLHNRLLHDQSQPSPTSTLYTSSKQTFDFLSLSTGSGGVENTKNLARSGNLIKPWAPFHIPYLQSIAQYPAHIPFSVPQSRFSTSPFNDHFSTTAAKQVQTQLQSYSNNSTLGPAQIQHQQQIWASQFASRYKPMGISAPHNNPNIHPMYMPMNHQQEHNLTSLASSVPSSRAKKNFTIPLHLLCKDHI